MNADRTGRLARWESRLDAGRARFDPLADDGRPDETFERNWHAALPAAIAGVSLISCAVVAESTRTQRVDLPSEPAAT